MQFNKFSCFQKDFVENILVYSQTLGMEVPITLLTTTMEMLSLYRLVALATASAHIPFLFSTNFTQGITIQSNAAIRSSFYLPHPPVALMILCEA
jgi:hypothetical protein